VSTLIRGDANGMRIFLDGTIHNLIHRPVMPQVDNFCPGILEHPAHDVDGHIMTVKKGCSRNDPDLVFGFILFVQNAFLV
jgi:hypothetical protein